MSCIGFLRVLNALPHNTLSEAVLLNESIKSQQAISC